MKKELINTIEQGMLGILNNEQLAKLHEVLEFSFAMFAENYEETQYSNDELLKLFLSAKQVEGCSERSLKYYRTTLSKMNEKINKSVRQIETNDIRTYISNYENETSAGKVTLDNIRRIISSFFAWLEDENYIVKSPVRRIHKVKTTRRVKETLTDENLEKLRDTCSNVRDLAILELLISTGMRVGEITRLNISDMNFQERSCIVLGKGNSEREVYFSAKSKMYIKKYLETRTDDNEALFVSLIKPYNRLGISGIEILIRNLGKDANINKVHPHKFRRTMATMAIDKGMPIEQVQKLLGHIKIDTTMEYAMVNQNNVKNSHRKYIT